MIKDLTQHLTGLFLASTTLASQAFAADEDFNAAAVGAYQDPGYAASRDYSGEQQVDSVDPFTGALKILVRDLLIPGNGGLDIEACATTRVSPTTKVRTAMATGNARHSAPAGTCTSAGSGFPRPMPT